MEPIEKKLWNTIADSAKTKFEYSSFEEGCPSSDIANEIIFSIITGFAAKKSVNDIVQDLHQYMLTLGFIWGAADIQKFVTDKEVLFGLEILATQIAIGSLNSGIDTLQVYSSTCQLLQIS